MMVAVPPQPIMEIAILLLTLSVLAGVGMAVFFWTQIRSERNAATACMHCRQQMAEGGSRSCPRCGFVVCLPCREQNSSCPHCKVAWPRAAEGSAKMAG